MEHLFSRFALNPHLLHTQKQNLCLHTCLCLYCWRFLQTEPGLGLTPVRPRASSGSSLVEDIRSGEVCGCTTDREQRLSQKNKPFWSFFAAYYLLWLVILFVSRINLLPLLGANKQGPRRIFLVLPWQRLGWYGFLVSWIMDWCWICGVLNFSFCPRDELWYRPALSIIQNVPCQRHNNVCRFIGVAHQPWGPLQAKLSPLYSSHQICSH